MANADAAFFFPMPDMDPVVEAFDIIGLISAATGVVILSFGYREGKSNMIVLMTAITQLILVFSRTAQWMAISANGVDNNNYEPNAPVPNAIVTPCKFFKYFEVMSFGWMATLNSCILCLFFSINFSAHNLKPVQTLPAKIYTAVMLIISTSLAIASLSYTDFLFVTKDYCLVMGNPPGGERDNMFYRLFNVAYLLPFFSGLIFFALGVSYYKKFNMNFGAGAIMNEFRKLYLALTCSYILFSFPLMIIDFAWQHLERTDAQLKWFLGLLIWNSLQNVPDLIIHVIFLRRRGGLGGEMIPSLKNNQSFSTFDSTVENKVKTMQTNTKTQDSVQLTNAAVVI